MQSATETFSRQDRYAAGARFRQSEYTAAVDKLSSLLPAVLRKRGLKEQADASLVMHRAGLWLSENMPELKESVEPRTLKDGVLLIACAHGIAMQELRAASTRLLSFLGGASSGIKEIRLTRGEIGLREP